MSKRRLPEDDARAFEQAMSGARPLPGGPRRLVGPAAGGGPAVSRPAARAVHPAPVRQVQPGGDGASGRAADVSARELRALRTGDRRPEARLDLHGMTRDEAVAAVGRFVQQCRSGGFRAVMVIHGRGLNSDAGAPVLRPALHAWLGGAAGTRAGVMAFAPAPPRWGRAGATLILLRR
ncbi:MAG TPA: Smr/MutS family protein [Polyangia bacterium]|nr:Smr/MutS family protein [Polyangia bacterium]